MSLQDTPSAERTHIGFFGCTNAGKSSLVNAVTSQPLSVVSDVHGTTTDPVRKAMEILPLGPVVIIDTPGFDDVSALGALRVEKMKQVLDESDIAVLVADAAKGLTADDRELLAMIRARQLPHLIVYSKADLQPGHQIDISAIHASSQEVDISINNLSIKEAKSGLYNSGDQLVDIILSEPKSGEVDINQLHGSPLPSQEETGCPVLYVSAATGEGIFELKELLGHMVKDEAHGRVIARDLVHAGDTVVLVCPIDESAPKGRLILPQVQTIRDLLDGGISVSVTKETTLQATLDSLKEPPALVITDSQAFKSVAQIVPESVPLTSFSILMARYKGFLETAVRGIRAAGRLKDGDRVLMAEGCTHHRQCNDIGTVKIPRWLKNYAGCDLKIETTEGRGFPEDLTPYALVIHCGGCMLTERAVQRRMRRAVSQGVAFTNYGIAIAEMTGILTRATAMFPGLSADAASGLPEVSAGAADRR